jgi:hypothetical protein
MGPWASFLLSRLPHGALGLIPPLEATTWDPGPSPVRRRTLSACIPASAAWHVCCREVRKPATLRTPCSSTSAPSASVTASTRCRSCRLQTQGAILARGAAVVFIEGAVEEEIWRSGGGDLANVGTRGMHSNCLGYVVNAYYSTWGPAPPCPAPWLLGPWPTGTRQRAPQPSRCLAPAAKSWGPAELAVRTRDTAPPRLWNTSCIAVAKLLVTRMMGAQQKDGKSRAGGRCDAHMPQARADLLQ